MKFRPGDLCRYESEHVGHRTYYWDDIYGDLTPGEIQTGDTIVILDVLPDPDASTDFFRMSETVSCDEVEVVFRVLSRHGVKYVFVRTDKPKWIKLN